jgi:hypothetical protein
LDPDEMENVNIFFDLKDDVGPEWRELKHAIMMLYELERRPAGDTVLTGLEEWSAAQACWAAKYKGLRCGSSVYDKVLSPKAIKVLDSLPSAVEVPIYESA